MAQIPSIGRIVHFRIGGTDEFPNLRPATVVNSFGYPDAANIVVELDVANDSHDARLPELAVLIRDHGGAIEWASIADRDRVPVRLHLSSATAGDGVGHWRWPVFVAPKG